MIPKIKNGKTELILSYTKNNRNRYKLWNVIFLNELYYQISNYSKKKWLNQFLNKVTRETAEHFQNVILIGIF
jgi:hypothetical protein